MGTDFSEAAELAVREAHRWCHLWGASLLIVHILDESRDMRGLRLADAERRGLPEEPKDIADAVAAIAHSVREGSSVEVATSMSSGSPYAELSRLAEVRGAALLVVGATGRTGLPRAILGSVAERVVRLAHCPVLVVRPSAPASPVIGATDFSAASLPALRAATDVAGCLEASLAFVHCLQVPPTALCAAANALFSPGDAASALSRANAERLLADASLTIAPAAERIVIEGDAARSIIRLAEERGSGLVVVGARGRTGTARVLLGSVAELVVRHAPCSVLAVRLPIDVASRT